MTHTTTPKVFLRNAARTLRLSMLAASVLFASNSFATTLHLADENAPTPSLNFSPGVLVAAVEQRIYGVRGLPVASVGEKLLVIGARTSDFGPGKGRLLLLNASNGALQQSVALSFPDEVFANPFAVPARELRFTASTLPNGKTQLHWHYRAHALRGALLESDESSAEQVLDGAFLLDLSGAEITASETSASDASTRSIELIGDERVPTASARQFRSADSAHALASTSEADPIFGTRYRWTLYQRASGKAIGEITQISSFAPFFVDAQRLLTALTPIAFRNAQGEVQSFGTRLAGYDLSSGKETYVIAILDLTYRGVMPP
jgi:hypothetical protein